jgi:hypothetical protein
VYIDSYRDGKIGYTQNVIRPNGPKHIFINHIAISTNIQTFQKQNILGLNHRISLERVLGITCLALDLKRNKQAY